MKTTLLTIALLALLPTCATADQPKTETKKEVREFYVAGEAFPDMTTRRAELIPQALPARVHYRFSDGAVVNRLADRLAGLLVAGDPALFSNTIMLQPGAWAVLKNRGKIAAKDPTEIRMSGMSGRLLRSKEGIAALAKELASVLAEDGGFNVRSFTTTEMAKWWVYIGFDIEEPVFVVASKGGKYKFIIDFLKDDRVLMVDELNSWPDAG